MPPKPGRASISGSGPSRNAAQVRQRISRRTASRRAPTTSTAEHVFPRDLWPEMGALGLHGITVGRGVRRRGPGLSRACAWRWRRFRARRASVGPVLRRPFESVRQPDPPQRQRRAEAQISAQADFRRARRRAGDERAGRRLRRGVDAHCAPTRRATATSSTAPRCGSPTARTPTRWWSMPRPTATAGARGITAFIVEKGHEGLLRRRRSSTSSACAAPTPASWCSRIARCRRRTCSARSATASGC